MQEERLKVAVVGVGKMGLLHASILNTFPDIELVALCDKSILIRNFFRRVIRGVQIVDDVEEFSNLDLDVVYVTSPIPSHYPITSTIYSQGMADNVFVEKTLGSSFDQARKMSELSQNSRGVNMVGYMKRFAATFRKVKHLLDQEILGEIISFNAYAYSSDFWGANEASKASASRGGVLLDLGSHMIDLSLWFFGDFQVRSAVLKSLNRDGPEDYASFDVKTDSGLEGRFRVSWCMEDYRMPEFGLMIRGNRGTVKVDDYKIEAELDNKIQWYRQDLDDNVPFLLGEPEYYREDRCFIESILEQYKPEPSFETSSKVDYIIGQVRKRANNHV